MLTYLFIFKNNQIWKQYTLQPLRKKIVDSEFIKTCDELVLSHLKAVDSK